MLPYRSPNAISVWVGVYARARALTVDWRFGFRHEVAAAGRVYCRSVEGVKPRTEHDETLSDAD